MSHWDDIRKLARKKHTIVRAKAQGKQTAKALVAAAQEITQIQVLPVPAGDPLLDGGEAMLDMECHVIWYNQDLDPDYALYLQVHEFSHYWLHGTHASCSTTDIDMGPSDEELPLGVNRVEGYSPEEQGEREANVFAREFLLPCDDIKQWYLDAGLNARDIASQLGVPYGIVVHQLTRALLIPNSSTNPEEAFIPVTTLDLDPSQQEAANVQQGPLLLEAGPGTGKTRTLVGRILHLLDQGTSPTAILALTFSNRAAEEMRMRVAHVAPDAAPHIWMGTFHAFGLELLRKYGARLGLPSRLTILDPIDALFLLEGELPSLGLSYYQNLYEPTSFLDDLLRAISRAKDELVGPAEYKVLADRMRDGAQTQEEIEAAEKALEVARVYEVYQRLLEREGALDFGDLIFRAFTLLQTHPDIRGQLRTTYTEILVDEYQDVNRASGMLLRELAGKGDGLWVVGDARQAIYRFRGAAPRNVRLFTDDFPGATRRALERNYRSQASIIDVIAMLAPQMRISQGTPSVSWIPHRKENGGEIRMEVADNREAEGYGLAAEIERQRAKGVSYRNQAVLCRSHTGLAHVVKLLEQAGIPTLSLGDLFERAEIRDLLSLLSLTCEGDGAGLIRVAHFEEYQIPLADVRSLLAFAREQDVPFPRALQLASELEGITSQGRAGLARLDEHLDGICYGNTAWGFLVNYLFDRSNYLRTLLQDTSVSGQQQHLAIFQLLQFAHQQREMNVNRYEDPKRAFLWYIRRLKQVGGDKQLRQVPEWADSIDAVRLLTVHASKGLEFQAVYLPFLGRGYFPTRKRGEPCPPPDGMLPESDLDQHQEEEECLFFVAISRARDFVCFSRAQRYGSRKSNPSGLLSLISGTLPYPPTGEATWRGIDEEQTVSLPRDSLVASEPPTFVVEHLDLYLRCPRQYYYEFYLGLSGRREDAAYVQFHRCVYKVIRWLRAEHSQKRTVNEAEMTARLAEVWEAHGPIGHPYETIYRQEAEAMVIRAFRQSTLPSALREQPEWEIDLPHGRVKFRPDEVIITKEEAGSSVIVRRMRTGRPSKREADKNIYALYHAAAGQNYPHAERAVQIDYLSIEESRSVPLSQKKLKTRLDRYDAAIVGILRQSFPADPDNQKCPRCPHYFICPAGQGV